MKMYVDALCEFSLFSVITKSGHARCCLKLAAHSEECRINKTKMKHRCCYKLLERFEKGGLFLVY